MDKRNALGYSRVSTADQAENGISLDTQSKRINDYCNYKNLNLVKIYQDEGLSGKNMNRPQLKDLLNNIKKDDYIIIAELSRLSRNTSDALNILNQIYKKEAILISLNPDIDFSSPSGKMMFTILSSINQFERECIGERVSLNMLNLSKQNKLRPKPPFGYKFIGKDQNYVIDEEQQEVIKEIVNLFNEGQSYSKISRHCNDKKYNKLLDISEKHLFYPQTIKNILTDCDLVNQPKRKSIKNKFLNTRNKKNLNLTV